MAVVMNDLHDVSGARLLYPDPTVFATVYEVFTSVCVKM